MAIGDLGIDLSQYIPPPVTIGNNPQDTINDLVMRFNNLIAGLQQYSDEARTKARLGVLNVSDGTNTLEIEDGTLYLSGDGDTSVSLVGGEMVFSSTSGTGNTTYSSAGSSPPASPVAGDTWYVTADGGGYVQGRTYRYSGSAWVWVGNLLYNTTITAGQITISYGDISGIPNDLSDINSSEGSKLSGIASGATVGATWGSNLNSIPQRLAESMAGQTGLGFTTSYLGFFSSGTATTYIKSDGAFRFYKDANNLIQWDGATFTLKTETIYVSSTGFKVDSANKDMVIGTVGATNDYIRLYETGSVPTLYLHDYDGIYENTITMTGNQLIAKIGSTEKMKYETDNNRMTFTNGDLIFNSGGVTIRDSGGTKKAFECGYGEPGNLGWDSSTKITWADTGVVSVPAVSLTGTVDEARLPALSARFLTGTYTGNGGASKDIATTGFNPKMVWVHKSSSDDSSIANFGGGEFLVDTGADTTYITLGTDKFTVSGTDAYGLNENGVVYYWFAVGNDS